MLTEILIIGLILTSLVLMVLGILSIKEKFVKKYFLFVAVLTAVFFAATLIVNAQEKPEGKNETKMTMQQEDMEECMDKIAANSTMRMQMMDKMMQHTKGDTTSMIQMCEMMMDNPEMHKMMMKMMHDGMMDGKIMNHDMMKDSTKNKSDHESHHQKK